MKSNLAFRNIILSAAVFALYLAPIGCKEDLPTVQEQVTELLVAAEAWAAPVVTVDGIDVSETYKNFSISFGEGTYKTSSGAPIWASSGKWVFTDDKATHMLMDDTVDVTIEVAGHKLVLERFWEFETFEPGRLRSVKGNHKFELTNQ